MYNEKWDDVFTNGLSHFCFQNLVMGSCQNCNKAIQITCRETAATFYVKIEQSNSFGWTEDLKIYTFAMT